MTGKKQRTPIGLEDTSEACRMLQAEGETPTVRSIRALLGRGSFSTIQQHLDILNGQAGSPAEEIEQFGTRLTELCAEMIEHINELASAELSRERDELKKYRLDLQEKAKASDHEKALLVVELDAEKTSSGYLKAQVGKLQESLEDLNQKFIEQSSTSARLESELEAEKKRYASAQSDLEKAHQQMRHYEQRTEERRNADIELHRSEMANLSSQIEKLRRLEAEALGESRSQKAINVELEKKIIDQDNQLTKITFELAELNTDHSNAQATLRGSEQQLAELKEKTAEALLLASSKDQVIQKLQDQVIQLHQDSSTARDQISRDAKAVLQFVTDFASRAYELATADVAGEQRNEEINDLRAQHAKIMRLVD